MGTAFAALDTTKTRLTYEGHEVPVHIGLSPEWEHFSFNMRSAAALFTLLGVASSFPGRPVTLDPQYGQVGIAEARRLVMAARARFATVAPVVLHVAESLSVLEVGGRVLQGPSFGAEELRDRLNGFAAFVEASSKAGANAIVWF